MANMYQGLFMVIAVLVVFASQDKADSSSLLISPPSLTATTGTPAFAATTTAINTGSPTPTTATTTGTLTTTTTTGAPTPTPTTGTPIMSTTPGAPVSTTTTGAPTTTATTGATPSTPTTGTPTTTSTSTTVTTTGTSSPTPKQKTCFILRFIIVSPKSLVVQALNIKTLFKPHVRNMLGSYAELKFLNLTITGNKMEARVHVVAHKTLLEDIFLEWMKKNNGKFEEFTLQKDSLSFEACEVTYKDWKAMDGECKNKCSEGGGGPILIEGKCEPNTGFSCNGLNKTETKKTKGCEQYCFSDDSSAVAISFFVLTMGILLSFSLHIGN